MKRWGGRAVALLVAQVLATKGRTCHLCGFTGADSADHDPPRSVLIKQGIPDPDLICYLYPAHLSCNKWRRARPLTDELRARAHQRRRAQQAAGPVDMNALSPRFARRINLLREAGLIGMTPTVPSPRSPQKRGN